MSSRNFKVLLLRAFRSVGAAALAHAREFRRLGRLFVKNHGLLVAAASCFFALISFFPLVTALIQSAFFFVGNDPRITQKTLSLINEFFPKISQDVLSTLGSVLKQQSRAQWGWAQLINFCVLLWSASNLFDSFFKGLEILGKGQFDVRRSRLRSFGLILMTLMSLILLTYLTPLSMLILQLFRTDFVQSLPLVSTFSRPLAFLVRSDTLSFIFIWLYFSFLFRLLIGPKAVLKDAYIGSLWFVIFFLVAKKLFWLYLQFSGEAFELRYGSFYLFILSILWAYYTLIAFFFSVQIVASRAQRSRAKLRASR